MHGRSLPLFLVVWHFGNFEQVLFRSARKSVAPQHPKAREAAGILQPDWEGR
jgi:hypothetical protein